MSICCFACGGPLAEFDERERCGDAVEERLFDLEENLTVHPGFRELWADAEVVVAKNNTWGGKLRANDTARKQQIAAERLPEWILGRSDL